MHWPFDFARSPFQQQGFATAMNTVNDISYCPSAEEKTRNAEQIDLTGRRNWKLMKGKKEAVWPPNLEAVLLEALRNYKPHSSKPLEQLGRFPMRNRFISDYIYETTGKRRTPKQVGSRLQQLRDTCKKAELLKLISRRNGGGEHSQNSSSPILQYPPTRNLTPLIDHNQSNVIYAEIVLNERMAPCPIPAVILNSVINSPAPRRIRLAPSNHQNVPSPVSPTELSEKDPTIKIHSPCPLFNQTIFSVFCEGSANSTHYEVGSLRCHSSPPETDSWIYSSLLIPAFWDFLCEDKDPTKYTIQQKIIPLRPLPSSQKADRSEMTITLVYRFVIHTDKTGFDHEREIFPLFTTLPLESGLSYEHSNETSHRDNSWPSQSMTPSPQQSPRVINYTVQTRCSDDIEIIASHAPFSYLSSNPNNSYGPCVGNGSPGQCCQSRNPWLQPTNFYEGRLPLNTFHQAECPTSF